MKKLFFIAVLVCSILSFPFVTTSFDALAGRTAGEFGGGECDCANPEFGVPCYTDATLTQLCSASRFDGPSRESISNFTQQGADDDYSSALLAGFTLLFLAGLAIRNS
jgi:hypothetical protein